jgi:hypothetical protein
MELMKRYSGILAALSVLAILGISAVPANAAFMLRLMSGATTILVTDQGAGDLTAGAGEVGIITFIGVVGGFNINVTIGSSKPLLGSASLPTMNITSLNATTTGGAPAFPRTLKIELTDTDFIGPLPSPAGFNYFLSGTLVPGTLSGSAFVDDGNVGFATTTQIGSTLSGGPGDFSASTSGSAPFTAPYSATIVATITHTAPSQTTTFDTTLSAVPEPTSLLLLGSGLAALGLRFRRKVKKA